MIYLQLTIGPVQSFIWTARRTRDLWAGSEILVELARTGAKAMQDAGAELIFPTSPTAPGASNVLAATCTAEGEAVLRRGVAAVEAAWNKRVGSLSDLRAVLPGAQRRLYDQQLAPACALRVVGVAVERGTLAQARTDATRILASRKALRDFGPYVGANLQKNSLDGTYETVLPERERDRGKVRHVLGARHPALAPREQLDGLGVVKRFTGRHRGFESTTEVAVAPFLRRVDALVRLDDTVARAWQDFQRLTTRQTWEAGWLYPARHEELAQLYRLDAKGMARIDGARQALCRLVRLDPAEECTAFGVVLADGDRMGEALAACGDVKALQAISAALSKFSISAQRVVEAHGGRAVYTGGDDVLALAPVDQLLALAAELRACFTRELGGRATLSVGLAVNHHTNPLSQALDRARQAERLAKTFRLPERGDGTALLLAGRSSDPLVLVGHNGDPVWDLPGRLGALVDALDAERLPWGLGHELLRLVETLGEGGNSADRVLRYELERVVARKFEGRGLEPEMRDLLQGWLGGVGGASEGLRALALDLRAARQFARWRRVATGRQP